MSLQQFGETSPLNASRDAIDPVQLRKFCNKPTALCWAYSAQMDDRCPRLIFGCIYEEWSRCRNHEPRIDFEHFFANPVSITSAGPTTISGILEAYVYLYNKTQELALSKLAPISTIKRSLYPLTNHTESHRIFDTDNRVNKVTDWQTRRESTILREARYAVSRVRAAQRGQSHLNKSRPPHFDGRWKYEHRLCALQSWLH